MNNLKWLTLVLAMGLSMSLYFNVQSCTSHPIETSDTIIRVDTVVHAQPVAVDCVIVRTEKIKVPVYKHISDTVLAMRTDTIRDSITVELPITQKTFAGNDYKAWVSGYRPELDSIAVYPKTTTIYKTKEISTVKRWGVGPQAGIGYCNGKAAPYIGIGIQYNIFSW